MHMDEQLIAPCGMNCGVCVSYLAMQNDLKKKGYYKKYCPGCQPRGENCTYMKSSCSLLGDGLVRFCHECGQFPCDRLKRLDHRYRTKYHMSMIDNLRFIREKGMPAFLAKEQEKWRCPDCGSVITCHSGICLSCDLDRLRRKKTYCWDDDDKTNPDKTTSVEGIPTID